MRCRRAEAGARRQRECVRIARECCATRLCLQEVAELSRTQPSRRTHSRRQATLERIGERLVSLGGACGVREHRAGR